jgi:hypothetical protein
MTRITYAKFPPKTLFVKENANNQPDAAGPIMRCIDATVCPRPCVAPSNRLLGTAEETYMNTATDKFVHVNTSVMV